MTSSYCSLCNFFVWAVTSWFLNCVCFFVMFLVGFATIGIWLVEFSRIQCMREFYCNIIWEYNLNLSYYFLLFVGEFTRFTTENEFLLSMFMFYSHGRISWNNYNLWSTCNCITYYLFICLFLYLFTYFCFCFLMWVWCRLIDFLSLHKPWCFYLFFSFFPICFLINILNLRFECEFGVIFPTWIYYFVV